MSRCFGDEDELYAKYHDEEWGVPVHDDRHLFEMLILEGAQAGLSWITILKRREAYRKFFHNFNPGLVANMSDAELENLANNPAIIRNKRKIFSARQNAKVFLAIQKEFGSFDHYLWGFVENKPIMNRWERREEVPVKTELSTQISKDLQKRGMSFVGPTILYAYMQAVGLIHDHLLNCRASKQKQ